MTAWLDLDGKDVVVFTLACLVGFIVGRFVPAGAISVYTSILVSYHLFLAWLVVSGEREAAISMPVLSTIATHLAFMAVVIAIGMGRHIVPFFSILRYGMAGLAIFERAWLFSANEVKPEMPKNQETAPAERVIVASGEDEQEWLRYLARRKAGLRPAGSSLKTEYEQWMQARIESRAHAAKGGDPDRL